jgi:predicted SprT family Zn-dependent metalloprotease
VPSASPTVSACRLRTGLDSITAAKAEKVRDLARRLLDAHGLSEWSFGFNRRRRSLGLCDYHRQAIELSLHFIERNGPDAILDTLLHEIAHALVGPGHGHDAAWKGMCSRVGARPVACRRAEMPAGRWRATCGGCGKLIHRYRRPKRLHGWYCVACGEGLGHLIWERATL